MEALDEVRSIIGDHNAMAGSAVAIATATESTVSQIPVIAAFAILFAFLVLILTTTSYVEPAVILAGLGVAVIINSGSNLLFGEISFVTNAAGSILQLAVSLDYTVFLLHRFAEYRKEIPRSEGSNGAGALKLDDLYLVQRNDHGNRFSCTLPDALSNRP